MGIPKFFRWISERYPLCSQLITGSNIPEFDNLYLDMNGIVHNCSHGNDPNRQITQDQMFIAMFDYIDHLFQIIQPKHLFYMAIDGVAPRAKMNQQRSRRFRTALEAQLLQKKILAEGEQILLDSKDENDDTSDDEVKAIATNRFDSNCITPGTPFMKSLTAHLQYFIRKKMTEDSKWRNVRVILSGPEVPGEGEHKIMEYIRHARTQPDYNPNIRHCLYGLDADLIMLGLVTHEPHFSLLREEVIFGKEAQKKAAVAGLHKQKFYLMHLSLMREYLGHEFAELKDNMQIKFSQERVIDDFILLSLFVGNDFIPHLPHLHINEGALSLMFAIYKSIMTNSKYYLHENGRIHIPTVLRLLQEMVDPIEREALELCIGYDQFGNEVVPGTSNSNHRGSKPTNRKTEEKAKPKDKKKGKTISVAEKHVLDELVAFVNGKVIINDIEVANLIAAKFLETACFKMRLDLQHPAFNSSSEFNRLEDIQEWPSLFTVYRGNNEEGANEEVDDVQLRYLKKFKKVTVIEDDEKRAEIDRSRMEAQLAYSSEWQVWKSDYYTHKLDFQVPAIGDDRMSAEVSNLIGEYLRGLQWVLLYYYDGVASWGWFYPYHYAPHISDIIKINPANISFKFEFGKPFRPFDQLMGVLPAFSRQHIPEPLQNLMVDPNSPIIDFYPTEFELDMNGKKADWEAVVKIPFIDQTRLLSAIKSCENRLSVEERQRNSIGTAFVFTYSPVSLSADGTYPSTMPGLLPKLTGVKCVGDPYMLPPIPSTGFRYGLCDGLKPMAGFPSLHTVKHSVEFAKHGVQVFQHPSQSDTAVITVTKDQPQVALAAKNVLGKSIFVNWPFLVEGTVDLVADTSLVYSVEPKSTRADLSRPQQWTEDEYSTFIGRSRAISKQMLKRFGVVLEPTLVMVGVRLIRAMQRSLDGSTKRVYHTSVEWYPWQMTVEPQYVGYTDMRYKESCPLPVEVEFPVGTRIFYLGKDYYGCPGHVIASTGGQRSLDVKIMQIADQNELVRLGRRVLSDPNLKTKYVPAYVVARQVNLSTIALSRLTSNLVITVTRPNSKNPQDSSNEMRWNLGLQMKNSSKGTQVLGYARQRQNGWEYSPDAIALITSFYQTFPEFVDRLRHDPDSRDPSAMYCDKDFYAEESFASLERIRKWIRASPVADFVLVPSTVTALTKTETLALERAVQTRKSDLVGRRPDDGMHMPVLKNVPAELVLKPEFSEVLLVNQQFNTGDRVICVSDLGKAPCGAYGYVVGCNEDLVEVMFDDTFLGATDLNARCSDLRGLVIRGSHMLNLSAPQGHLPWMKQMRGLNTKASNFHPPISSNSQSGTSTALPTHNGPKPKQHEPVAPAPPHGKLDGLSLLRQLQKGTGTSAASKPSVNSAHPPNLPNKPSKIAQQSSHQPTEVLDGAKLLQFIKFGHTADVESPQQSVETKRTPTMDGKALEMSLKQLLNLGGQPPYKSTVPSSSTSSSSSKGPVPSMQSSTTSRSKTNDQSQYVWPHPPVVDNKHAMGNIIASQPSYSILTNSGGSVPESVHSNSNHTQGGGGSTGKGKKKSALQQHQFLVKSGKYHGQRQAKPNT